MAYTRYSYADARKKCRKLVQQILRLRGEKLTTTNKEKKTLEEHMAGEAGTPPGLNKEINRSTTYSPYGGQAKWPNSSLSHKNSQQHRSPGHGKPVKKHATRNLTSYRDSSPCG